MPSGELWCFRCPNQPIGQTPSELHATQFYVCPVCKRQYSRPAEGVLTFRWLHPISLALYGFVGDSTSSRSRSEESMESCAGRCARQLIKGRTQAQAESFLKEIDVEFLNPTHSVRATLDTKATENECRAFLALVVREVKSMRTVRQDPSGVA